MVKRHGNAWMDGLVWHFEAREMGFALFILKFRALLLSSSEIYLRFLFARKGLSSCLIG